MGQAERTVRLLTPIADSEGALLDIFAPGRVAVCLSPESATGSQNQLVFSFAVNLLSRLYPVVQELAVVMPRGVPAVAPFPKWRADYLDEHVKRFLLALDPPLRWTIATNLPQVAECSFMVGQVAAPPGFGVWVGADGWEATMSPDGPVATGDGTNPVGAYAAACLGVAEVWKRLLHPHRGLLAGTPVIPADQPVTFSSFTYRTGQGQPNPPIPVPADVGRLTMVGLGAGGGAAAFTLASVANLAGAITQVEPDEILEPNLNRCVFADGEDAAAASAKTKVVEALFSHHPSVSVRSLRRSHDDVVGELDREDYRYVIAAVHSREARRAIQYETPMVLWDAGATGQGDFFIWRHILGVTDCMWCKHPPGEMDPEEQKARQLAQLVGLDAGAWLRKVRTNERFSPEEVAVIREGFSSPDARFDAPVAGQRYGDWEVDQCGRLALPDVDDEIPVPFAPVMAGVLLAGEVIKQHHFPEAVLDSYYWNTLVGRFMLRNQPYRRRPNADCRFCSDGAYLDQYGRRWN